MCSLSFCQYSICDDRFLLLCRAHWRSLYLSAIRHIDAKIVAVWRFFWAEYILWKLLMLCMWYSILQTIQKKNAFSLQFKINQSRKIKQKTEKCDFVIFPVNLKFILWIFVDVTAFSLNFFVLLTTNYSINIKIVCAFFRWAVIVFV